MKKKIHILVLMILATLSYSDAWSTGTIVQDKWVPEDSIPQKNNPDTVAAPKKVCSCTILEVKKGRYDSRLVAIFAEKTLEGKKRNNYKVLNSYIRREKVYFRVVFYESPIRQRETLNGEKDCKSLFKQLRLKDERLQMYNIIDVDALTELVKK